MNQKEHWDCSFSEWEKPQFMGLLLEAFTQPIAITYDIGACVGGWSYVVTKHFNTVIYAFEPSLENFTELQNRKEELPNVISLNIGIWYGATSALTKWDGSNVGTKAISNASPFASVPNHELFLLTTLEQTNIPKPDFIKLDVEGAEKNIIEHSHLLKTTSQILLEWHYNEDVEQYITTHLPHKIISNIDNKQLLLRL